MNRDELEGKAKALKGKIKQATGDVTNNDFPQQRCASEGPRQSRCLTGVSGNI